MNSRYTVSPLLSSVKAASCAAPLTSILPVVSDVDGMMLLESSRVDNLREGESRANVRGCVKASPAGAIPAAQV